MTPNKNSDLENIAKILQDTTVKAAKEMNENPFLAAGELKEKTIHEFEGKMRASGMDIFNECTYISAISGYLSEADQEKHRAIGAVIFYFKKEKMDVYLKLFGFRDFNDESDDSMMETCGQVAKVFAEKFGKALTQNGYANVIFSEPENFYNDVFLGIEFSKKEYDQYQCDFLIKGDNAMAVDLTMAPIPKA